MKVSLNWLNEFVDLKDISINDIVSRFSLTTAEIEGYTIMGQNLGNVVVGEIKTVDAHPNSKKLHLLTVDNGLSVVPVVCGAPNVRVGLKVAFANIGAKLGDIEISKATVAGFESHGMCCSGRELGISVDHDGILELEPSAKVGTDITKAIPEILDTIIEIDNKSLTNRPDLWGHYGIAREMAVIFGKTLKPLAVSDVDKYISLPKIQVLIENKKDCLSYGAIRIDNITRVESPFFMQIRLFYCGISAHNFLVDLTNYIMLETAQPSHAFDAGKVGKISIGHVAEGTEFVTLKDMTVKALPSMLFIKSNDKPVALAGVMGGKNSEIDESTKNCVFEFATFDAACVRKTAGALGIRTDASMRYEKSLDTNLNKIAAERMLKFIEAYDKGAKVVTCFNHVVANPTRPVRLTLKKAYLEQFCGVSFKYNDMKKYLTGLGFNPVITDDEIIVVVPTFRATKDVTCEADLIEEIVRTFGYDKIKPIAPRVELAPVEPLRLAKVASRIKNLLSDKYACVEVHTYIWNDTKLNKQLGIETQPYLRVVNSCVKDNDAIRSELAPSIINVVMKNRSLDDIRIFEIGRVWTSLDDNKNAVEEQRLAVAFASKTKSGAELYKDLADALRDVFALIGFSKTVFELGAASQKYLHPKNNASVCVSGLEAARRLKLGGNISDAVTLKDIESVGVIGILHPTVAGGIDSKMSVACAEVNLTPFGEVGELNLRAVAVSKYPKTTLDFTFTTDKIYGEVERIFESFSHPLNFGFHLKDIFEEADGRLSYTVTFTVGSYEKTLTSAEIDGFWQVVIKHGRDAALVLKE